MSSESIHSSSEGTRQSSYYCIQKCLLEKSTIIKATLLVFTFLFIGGGIVLGGWGQFLFPQIFTTTISQIVTGCVLGALGFGSGMILLVLQCRNKPSNPSPHPESTLSNEIQESELQEHVEEENSVEKSICDVFEEKIRDHFIFAIGQNIQEIMQNVFMQEMKQWTEGFWPACNSVDISKNVTKRCLEGIVSFNEQTRELHFTSDFLELDHCSTEAHMVLKTKSGTSFHKIEKIDVKKGVSVYLHTASGKQIKICSP